MQKITQDKITGLSRKQLLAYILQDNPINKEDDCLGGSQITGIITNVLSMLKQEDLFNGNIAIFAPWGSGKTSLITMMKEELEEDNFIISWFDSWQYDNKPVNIAIGLLRKIATSIQDYFGDNEISKIFLDYLQSFIKMSVSADKLMFKATENINDLSGYCEWVDKIDTFKEKFQHVAKILLKEKKLVVFIDDLDRCQPKNVIYLLEIIKNFLSVDNIVFVVAMDKDVVKETINSFYNYRKEFGNSYLEKVFPFEFYFKYKEESYNLLIDRTLAEFLSDKEHISKLKITFRILPYNPRRLKAILKKLVFQSNYYNSPVDGYIGFLIIVLSTYFPEFYDTITNLDERTELNLFRSLVTFRELSDGYFKPEERERQISKFPGMAAFFNNDALLDFIKLIDGTLHFKENQWSLDIRRNKRPLKKLLDSIALS